MLVAAAQHGGAGAPRPGCIHMPKAKTSTNDIRVAVRLSLLSLSARSKGDQLPHLVCGLCGVGSSRIHCCLNCMFIGCWNGPAHIHRHFSDQQKGHFLGLDMARCQVYCARCRDYVYDSEIESIVRQERARMQDDLLRVAAPDLKRARFEDWRPTANDIESAKKHGSVGACSGLKGLTNLGSTCFMNSVLQALFHNPFMSAYFLSDKHPRRDCPIRGDAVTSDKKAPICLGCELDNLYSKMHQPSNARPLVPHELLHSMWSFAHDLAGYEQQDAHEFFIALLDGVHTHCKGVQSSDCSCIVHNAFGGALRSDVTCLTCGNISTSLDHYLNISVDIVSKAGAQRQVHATLADCLEQFTHPERLGAGDVRCSHCDVYRESTKQMSLRTLPVTLVLHLKRFEHTGAAQGGKIDAYCQFPLELDVTPYLSSTLTGGQEASAISDVRAVNMYSLYAVIVHVGTLESGHYISYLQWHGEWYKADDDTVTRASVTDVLQSKAYMLFYVKKTLEYAV